MHLSNEDIARHPSLRKALGLPDKQDIDSQESIIPPELLNYQPEPLPPIVVVQHGSDRVFTSALALALGMLLAPLIVMFAILGMQAPAGFVGIIVGSAITYGLTHRREAK